MTESLPISSGLPAQGVSAGGGAASRKSAESGEGAASFKALLEQLEGRARALESESSKELSPDELAGAVDHARASLEQALSLKDQLLEAWRAAQQTEPKPPSRS